MNDCPGIATGRPRRVDRVIDLVGSDEKIIWSQSADILIIDASRRVPNGIAIVFRITPPR